MSDVDGAAPAVAEPVPVPVDPPVVDTPNPIETIDEPSKPVPSTREALDRAFTKVEEAQKQKDDPKGAKEPAKAEPKDGPTKSEPKKDEAVRDETGKFAAKEGKPEVVVRPGSTVLTGEEAEKAKAAIDAANKPKSAYEAPKRLSVEERPVWEALPDDSKRLFARLDEDNEKGIAKQRQENERIRPDAEAFQPLKRFHEMAIRSGTTLPEATERLVNTEIALRQESRQHPQGYPLRTFEAICDQVGFSFREMCAHVAGQTPDQQASQSDATIRELKQTVAQLQEQVGGVTQTVKQQRENATLQEVNKFASEPAHSRFEELAEDIGFFMQSGRAKNLSEAYELAERLNPAPATASAVRNGASLAPSEQSDTSLGPKLDLVEQIRKGSKSPTGAPASDSTPANRRPSKSNREALDRAFAAIG